MSLIKKVSGLTVLLSCGLYSLGAISQSTPEVISAHPPNATESESKVASENRFEPEQVTEPERVYVESDRATYRGTRSDEHCFYNEEHDHIHCYDEDPGQRQDRVVYVENRTYRSTRHRDYDPIATGLGVGVAIGLPILIHGAIHDRRHYAHKYGRSYRNSYGHSDRHIYQSRYGSGDRYDKRQFRRDDKNRRSHRYDRNDRHDRSHDRSRKKYRANLP